MKEKWEKKMVYTKRKNPHFMCSDDDFSVLYLYFISILTKQYLSILLQ